MAIERGQRRGGVRQGRWHGTRGSIRFAATEDARLGIQLPGDARVPVQGFADRGDQAWQGLDGRGAITTGIVEQDDLSTRFGICIRGSVDGALDDFVRRDARLPVGGIDAHADHYIAQILRDDGRLDFARLVGFGIAKKRWPKQNRRTPRN